MGKICNSWITNYLLTVDKISFGKYQWPKHSMLSAGSSATALEWLPAPQNLPEGPQPPLVTAKARVADRPEDPNAHCTLGWCYVQVGRFERARTAYHRASELAPSHQSAYLGLAAVSFLNQNPEEGSRWLATAGIEPAGTGSSFFA